MANLLEDQQENDDQGDGDAQQPEKNAFAHGRSSLVIDAVSAAPISST